MIIPENYCHKNIVDTIIDIEKLAIEEEGRKEGRKELYSGGKRQPLLLEKLSGFLSRLRSKFPA